MADDVKWIKIVTDIFGNRKIKQIESMPEADSIIVIWFKLLCLAGTVNENGLVVITKDIPYNDEMLANEFKRPLPVVRLALQTFVLFGMVEVTDDIYMVGNWERYQNVESLSRIREQTKLRVHAYRERQKQLCNVTVTHGNETELRTKNQELRTKKDTADKCPDNFPLDKTQTKTSFVIPSIQEVEEYCRERNKGVDANKWHDFYTAKGWMIGKTKMKDWKAAVRTWEAKAEKKSESELKW